ncbi:alpha/beta hydrolase family esterase [Thiohalorhabdus methylotrophus]|uniref:PHB depolymerase family esterase n=1 Tax=Thiohalorhabdus methylotrophus TaxID=3242694 RepID=A0ABV4TU86_9GAMM
MSIPPRGRRILLGLALLLACMGAAQAAREMVLEGPRPVRVLVPEDVSAPSRPLVVLLHGYGVNARKQDAYLRLSPLVDRRRFLLALPDGTVDRAGKRGWNAGRTFGNPYGHRADDAAYLAAVIRRLQARFSADPRRIFLVGHSNGGRMAYQLVCRHPGTAAALVSLAGAQLGDPSRQCPPGPALRVLQIHGTADAKAAYGGGRFQGRAHPSAEEAAAQWAAYDGCPPRPAPDGERLDLEVTVPGPDTTARTHARGCRPGGAVTLWSVEGGGHVPRLAPVGESTALARAIMDWLRVPRLR